MTRMSAALIVIALLVGFVLGGWASYSFSILTLSPDRSIRNFDEIVEEKRGIDFTASLRRGGFGATTKHSYRLYIWLGDEGPSEKNLISIFTDSKSEGIEWIDGAVLELCAQYSRVFEYSNFVSITSEDSLKEASIVLVTDRRCK